MVDEYELVIGAGPAGESAADVAALSGAERSSSKETSRAACYAFGIRLRDAVDPMMVSAVYGMPEVAGAGLTEEQCRARGIDYEVGRCDLSVTPRGAIAGHGGMLKLIFRRDNRRLLGVHYIGDIASELVGIGQMAMHYGGKIGVFAEVTLNTPTYTYAYKYAALDGLKRLVAAQEELLSLATSGVQP